MNEGVELDDAFLVYALKGLVTLSKEAFVNSEVLREMLSEEVGSFLMQNMDKALDVSAREKTFDADSLFSLTPSCEGLLRH